MASSWETFCEAVADDLTTNVSALRDVRVHLLAPYDPEEQVSDGGERHLGVFPIAATAQEGSPQTTDGGQLLTETYRIVYWEDAGDESSRGIADVDAARDLLQLASDVRDRFFLRSNVFLGGTEFTRYIGTVFPDRSGQVRWFAIGVEARRSQSLS